MRNILAVIGLILTIALTIVLSTGRYAGLFRTAPGQQAAPKGWMQTACWRNLSPLRMSMDFTAR